MYNIEDGGILLDDTAASREGTMKGFIDNALDLAKDCVDVDLEIKDGRIRVIVSIGIGRHGLRVREADA